MNLKMVTRQRKNPIGQDQAELLKYKLGLEGFEIDKEANVVANGIAVPPLLVKEPPTSPGSGPIIVGIGSGDRRPDNNSQEGHNELAGDSEKDDDSRDYSNASVSDNTLQEDSDKPAGNVESGLTGSANDKTDTEKLQETPPPYIGSQPEQPTSIVVLCDYFKKTKNKVVFEDKSPSQLVGNLYISEEGWHQMKDPSRICVEIALDNPPVGEGLNITMVIHKQTLHKVVFSADEILTSLYLDKAAWSLLGEPTDITVTLSGAISEPGQLSADV
jgi:hypothetical protein